MLWIDKSGGPVVFIIAGSLVLFGGFLFASRPSLKKGLVTGVCAVFALGLVSTGAVMAVDGQRTIEAHPTTRTDNGAACELASEGPGTQAEVDKKGSQAVASKSAIGITVVLENHKLTAHELGLPGTLTTVTVSRGNIVNVIFKNRDPEDRRLTVNMGEFEQDIKGTKVKEHPKTCTTLVRHDGGSQFLSFILHEPTIASTQPYTFTVPGLPGAEISIVVP